MGRQQETQHRRYSFDHLRPVPYWRRFVSYQRGTVRKEVLNILTHIPRSNVNNKSNMYKETMETGNNPLKITNLIVYT